MSPTDFALIVPHLISLAGPARSVLIVPNVPIEYLYFPERGFTSVTADAHAGSIEVGMIGREGLVGASPLMLGVDRTPYQSFIQMAGENLRIAVLDFQDALARSPTMRALLLRYVQTILVQTAHTAFANAVFDIESRLSRWILMCHDRAEMQDIHITHEFLAMMLGVRRPGVTIAIQVLEGKGLIKATRGVIRMEDRPGLIVAAHESYGLPEAEYALLIDGLTVSAPHLAMPDRIDVNWDGAAPAGPSDRLPVR